MGNKDRRQQPPIIIRSARAIELLRSLVGPGLSQVEVIEQALEQMAARGRSLTGLLTPRVALDSDWEPPRSNLVLGHATSRTDVFAGADGLPCFETLEEQFLGRSKAKGRGKAVGGRLKCATN